MPVYNQRKGFALIITITLLAFLVLLLVSLSALSRVETQIAGNSQKISQARQNAMMALNIAIGQIQKYAGPDKAVSARASITRTIPPAVEQPYLTGIWNTSPSNLPLTSTPSVWLVSGNESPSSPTAITPTNVGDQTTGTEPVVDWGPGPSGVPGYVFLVSSKTVSDMKQRVRVPTQKITVAAGTVPGITTSATVGHYAYWVGDEGIKASASVINPLLTANAITYDNEAGSVGQGDSWTDAAKRARLNQLQLARPGLEKLFTVGPFDPDGASAVVGLPKVRVRQQLTLMTNSPTQTVLNQYFHALTPLSQAVLADVANGRLKKDLSDVAAIPPNPAILNFQQTRLVNPATGYNATYTPVKASVATATTYPAYSLGPVLTEVGIRFNFYISDVDNTVHYSYTIDAELWNPYAAELHLSAAAPLTVEISGLPAIRVTTDGLTDRTFTPTATATINGTATWNAGQIRVFRGGSALEPVGTPGQISDQIVPGATADATATLVTAAYTAASSLTVVLKVNGAELATYKPTKSFTAGSVDGALAASSTGWLLGYGYEFVDNLEIFTHGAAVPASFDARLPLLSGAFNHPSSPAWTGTPGTNRSGIGTVNTFCDTVTLVLYDLPRQEMTSLGMLTHVIGEKPYMVGNRWGGTSNAIFDQYHVSTVPRFAAAWTPESGLPLPNRYVSVYHPEGVSTLDPADLRSVDRSARYLLQTGAFNVNSTSTYSWIALLGSKFSAANLWSYSSSPGGIPLNNVFFRLPQGAQQLTNPPLLSGATGTSALTNDNAKKTGGRQLTLAEVTLLAQHLVQQLSVHGRPYVSLQEFINSGAIATAISFANLNSALFASNRFTPGALTQADVIAALSPFITVRSDTFLVRAYGDVENPVTETVEGRAWCEAVVQRLPDLADNASAPITDVISPNAGTYPFGRKFKIISFRWLTSSDI